MVHINSIFAPRQFLKIGIQLHHDFNLQIAVLEAQLTCHPISTAIQLHVSMHIAISEVRMTWDPISATRQLLEIAIQVYLLMQIPILSGWMI